MAPDRLTDPAAVKIPGSTRGVGYYAFITGFVLALAVTSMAVFLTVTAPGAQLDALSGHTVLIVLWFNLVLILALALGVAWRARRLFVSGDPAVRLHRRFVSLFALAAMAPAIIVALFFGVVVVRGMENWFSQRVRTVVENAATVARSYVNEQRDYIHSRIVPMAQDLNRAEPAFAQDRRAYSNFLAEQAVARDFAAVYVIDGKGQVLAQAESPAAPPYAAPSAATLANARDEVAMSFDNDDMGRAAMRLTAYKDAYLYVVRPIGQGIIEQLRRSEAAVVAYREAETNRNQVQMIFALSYGATALLVLIGAVWVGMAAANQITAPIARLVRAADRVAGGDLTARLDASADPEEIAVLSRAFNRMTNDLQAQQRALRAASLEAEQRRRFIETVLADVSAGVIGVDPSGLISVANQRALALLGLKENEAQGRYLNEASPELAEIASRAVTQGHDAEGEVDIVRKAETRRLRVRASARVEGGLVLTFDDITRLVAAQRNAAWKDVARRIAHEIKNPLTPIQLSAERIRRKYRAEITGDLETFDRCTDTIIRQVGDIGRMVDEFSAFARMPTPKFAPENAAELLRQAVFAQRVAYPSVTVTLDELKGEEPLRCDSRMVGQALANVLKNAGEAVMARQATSPDKPGLINARLVTDAGHVIFIVEDNGVGLPTKDRDRLTEPYVTTREKGTGLGLAIVKRILEEHGGELSLGDAPGGMGARAVLSFPRGGDALAPAGVAAE